MLFAIVRSLVFSQFESPRTAGSLGGTFCTTSHSTVCVVNHVERERKSGLFFFLFKWCLMGKFSSLIRVSHEMQTGLFVKLYDAGLSFGQRDDSPPEIGHACSGGTLDTFRTQCRRMKTIYWCAV